MINVVKNRKYFIILLFSQILYYNETDGDNMKKTNTRYQSLDSYYKNKYGFKVCKVPLNADFTCPNIDGTKGYGGCLFCSSLSSGEFAGEREDPLFIQFEKGRLMMQKKWPSAKFIPYLQANSNTYASLETLKKIYEEIASFPNIVELSIATRADCFTIEIYDYLAELNQRIPVQIELGLQSIHEATSNFIHRGHSLQEFEQAVIELRKRKIDVVVHIINGLPGETREMMLQTASYLNHLDIQGVKIHSLLLLSDSVLGQMYLENPFPILSLEEYVSIVCDQIECLDESIVLHRLSADGTLEHLIEPKWTIKKLVVRNEIDKELKKRNSTQGLNRCDFYPGHVSNKIE